MKRVKLFLILFLLFLLEGTIMPRLLAASSWWSPAQPVPNFLLVALLMISFFAGGSLAVGYAILFGFMTDLIYTSTLGVYAFCMGLAVYLIFSLSRWLTMNAAMTFLLIVAGVCLLQAEVYIIYLAIGQTAQPLQLFLQWRMPATAVLNAVFAMIIYYPFHRFLVNMNADREK